MNNKTGGPAFPHVVTNTANYADWFPGMTLLDYFAASAIAGLLNDNSRSPQIADMAIKRGITSENVMAVCAYEVADAMLAERKKRGIE